MTVFLTDMGQKDAFDRAFERVFRRVPEEGDAPGSLKVPAPGKAARGCPAPRPAPASAWPRFRTPPPWLKWNLKVLPDDGRSWQLPPPERIGFPPAAVFWEPLRAASDLQCASFRRLWRAFSALPCEGKVAARLPPGVMLVGRVSARAPDEGCPRAALPIQASLTCGAVPAAVRPSSINSRNRLPLKDMLCPIAPFTSWMRLLRCHLPATPAPWWTDADGIEPADMLRIARETNAPETAFRVGLRQGGRACPLFHAARGNPLCGASHHCHGAPFAGTGRAQAGHRAVRVRHRRAARGHPLRQGDHDPAPRRPGHVRRRRDNGPSARASGFPISGKGFRASSCGGASAS